MYYVVVLYMWRLPAVVVHDVHYECSSGNASQPVKAQTVFSVMVTHMSLRSICLVLYHFDGMFNRKTTAHQIFYKLLPYEQAGEREQVRVII